MKLNISFKQTQRDIKLFKFIERQEEKSEFVKKCVEYFIKNEIKKE